MSLTSLVALDEVTHGDDGGGQTLGDTLQDPTAPDPSAAYEDVELRAILAEAIERMSEREKTVVVLYYFEGMTLAQIGQVLGVTESRVCQLHTKAVLGLRTRITSRTRYPQDDVRVARRHPRAWHRATACAVSPAPRRARCPGADRARAALPAGGAAGWRGGAAGARSGGQAVRPAAGAVAGGSPRGRPRRARR